MTKKLWATGDIAREFGFSSAAVARSWIRRAGLEHVARDHDTGEKLYAPEAVREARRNMPGQGARTDREG